MSGIETVNSELAKYAVNYARSSWIERRIGELQADFEEATQSLKRLTVEVKEIAPDIEDLQGYGFFSTLTATLGEAAKNWGQEGSQTALGIWLAIQECHARIRVISKEKSRLVRLREQYLGAQETYKKALAEKHKMVSDEDGPVADIVELDSERESWLAVMVVLYEGIQAGVMASEILQALEKKLQQISSDLAVSAVLGSSGVGPLDNPKLDEAKLLARSAQNQIDKLEVELLELASTEGTSASFGGWAQFIDEWLDGFTYDLVVQKRIQDSLAQTRRIIREVHGAVTNLEGRWKTTSMVLESVAKKRDKLFW